MIWKLPDLMLKYLKIRMTQKKTCNSRHLFIATMISYFGMFRSICAMLDNTLKECIKYYIRMFAIKSSYIHAGYCITWHHTTGTSIAIIMAHHGVCMLHIYFICLMNFAGSEKKIGISIEINPYHQFHNMRITALYITQYSYKWSTTTVAAAKCNGNDTCFYLKPL